MSLAGKRALVTGAGSGAGAVIARALAEAGAAEVFLCGRRPGPLDALAARHPAFTALPCDITDEVAVEAAFAAAGPLDIVVANAGSSASAPLAKTSLAQMQEMVNTNLIGTFLTLREAARNMSGREGRVIAIASTAALKGYGYVAPYAAAKHGVLGLVRSAALEYARKGVTFNALCPGFMATEMTERSIANISATTGRSPAEARAALEATNPMRRLIAPQEVAEAVLWLCGPGGASVTGQAIPICGGEIV